MSNFWKINLFMQTERVDQLFTILYLWKKNSSLKVNWRSLRFVSILFKAAIILFVFEIKYETKKPCIPNKGKDVKRIKEPVKRNTDREKSEKAQHKKVKLPKYHNTLRMCCCCVLKKERKEKKSLGGEWERRVS